MQQLRIPHIATLGRQSCAAGARVALHAKLVPEQNEFTVYVKITNMEERRRGGRKLGYNTEK
jgi:hypothetical protein